MKKILIALISLLMLSSSYAQAQKILIAYYSWSGNTRVVATQIQALTGADIFEIKPVIPYSEDYDECVQVAKTEILENYKPELIGNVENLSQYDIIFVGSPNWWSTIAPPVATFLASYNFEGKTVIPFCTHGSGGVANLFTDMKNLCPNIIIENGFAISGKSAETAQSELQKWLQKLKIEN